MADTPMDYNLHHIATHSSGPPFNGNLQDIAEDLREAINEQEHKRLPKTPKRYGNRVTKRSATPSSSGSRRVTRQTHARTVQSPSISAPLSELTKDSAIPVRDIEAWVNRPASDRIAESTLKHGHISRPMNSFMLYRSAYAERTKEWCKHNNHQVVSTVAGESWPLEPQAVRDQFYEWARMDKENHAIAFPNYKFTPAKPRRKAEEYESDSAVGIDDAQSDAEYTPSRKPAGSRFRHDSATMPSRHFAQPAPYESNMGSDSQRLPANELASHVPNFITSCPNHWLLQHHHDSIDNAPFRGMSMGFHYAPGTFVQTMQGYNQLLQAPPMACPAEAAPQRPRPRIATRAPWPHPASSPRLQQAVPWSPFAGFSPILPSVGLSPFSPSFKFIFEGEAMTDAVQPSPTPVRAAVAVLNGTIDPRLLIVNGSVEVVPGEEGRE